jgi:tRNA-specific adenosine deaminase 3
MKQAGLDTPDLGHLKRIRKQNNVITLLLTTSPTPPVLPEDLELSTPYILPVPVFPALTPISLSLKSCLWPTLYTPSRKNEADSWTRGKCRWAWEAMKVTLEAAAEAKSHNEVSLLTPLTVSPC